MIVAEVCRAGDRGDVRSSSSNWSDVSKMFRPAVTSSLKTLKTPTKEKNIPRYVIQDWSFLNNLRDGTTICDLLAITLRRLRLFRCTITLFVNNVITIHSIINQLGFFFSKHTNTLRLIYSCFNSRKFSTISPEPVRSQPQAGTSFGSVFKIPSDPKTPDSNSTISAERFTSKAGMHDNTSAMTGNISN